jgi:ribosomal protein RSM22 (predicted rRNA methylase)
MQLPSDLIDAIESIVQQKPAAILKKARETLSQTYREGGTSRSIFQNELQSLVYLSVRFPATYAAVSHVLQKVHFPFACRDILDLGSGPGTASFAAFYTLPNIEKITLIERSSDTIDLGKKLGNEIEIFQKATWICQEMPCPLPLADLAILSYALGELDCPSKVIENWWESEIPFCVIIEPGTPRGFNLIKKIREQALDLGAHLLAPCPHLLPCPMQKDDWCHFS